MDETKGKINFFEDLPKVNIKYLVQEQIRNCLFAYNSINSDGGFGDEEKYQKSVNALWDLVDDFVDNKAQSQMVFLNNKYGKLLDKQGNTGQNKHNLQVELSRAKFKCIMRLLRRLNWV